MSGNVPFYRLGTHEAVVRAGSGQFPTPEEHPNLPGRDQMWALMRRCWAVKVEERPSMREVTDKVNCAPLPTRVSRAEDF